MDVKNLRTISTSVLDVRLHSIAAQHVKVCGCQLFDGKYWQSIIGAHWPTHKPNCHPLNEETSLKLKPFYPSGDNVVVSTSSIVRTRLGYSDLPKGKTSSSGSKALSEHKYPKQAIIKVQLPFAGPDASPKQQSNAEQRGNCLVYTKKRDFVCQFRQIDNPNAWKSLIKVIKTKGVGGLKAYFAADIRSEDEIVLKVSEVLAEQSFWHLDAASDTSFSCLKGVTYHKIIG